MSRAIVAVFGLAILAISGGYALEAALEGAGENHLVVNETFTPAAGSVTQLDESERAGVYYDHNVTVYDETGSEMTAGTDYRWFPGNGTIKTLTGGGLDGDASANATYGFQVPSDEERAGAALLANIPSFLGLVLPFAAVVIFFAILRGG